jgi:hypothetical protein
MPTICTMVASKTKGFYLKLNEVAIASVRSLAFDNGDPTIPTLGPSPFVVRPFSDRNKPQKMLDFTKKR